MTAFAQTESRHQTASHEPTAEVPRTGAIDAPETFELFQSSRPQPQKRTVASVGAARLHSSLGTTAIILIGHEELAA